MTRMIAKAHIAAMDASDAVVTALVNRRNRRGATFLEYAILAGGMIVIIGLVLTFMRGYLTGFWERISGLIDGSTS